MNFQIRTATINSKKQQKEFFLQAAGLMGTTFEGTRIIEFSLFPVFWQRVVRSGWAESHVNPAMISANESCDSAPNGATL
jgi:hypothetical protein